MALKPPIPSGSTYQVYYRANVGSAGPTLLVVLWIPNLSAPVPNPQETTIDPSVMGALGGTVPSRTAARRMEIRVDLPDGAGSGALTLAIDDAIHCQELITRDTTWTALVHE